MSVQLFFQFHHASQHDKLLEKNWIWSDIAIGILDAEVKKGTIETVKLLKIPETVEGGLVNQYIRPKLGISEEIWAGRVARTCGELIEALASFRRVVSHFFRWSRIFKWKHPADGKMILAEIDF